MKPTITLTVDPLKMHRLDASYTFPYRQHWEEPHYIYVATEDEVVCLVSDQGFVIIPVGSDEAAVLRRWRQEQP